MSSDQTHPFIPAEALARRATLRAVLHGMEGRGASREPASLQELRAVISGDSTVDPESILAVIIAGRLEEAAAALLKPWRRESHNRVLTDLLASRLLPLAAKAQRHRLAHWHLDTRHQLIRFCFAKEGTAVRFDDGEIHAIFLQAFRLEGLLIALDFGKRQHPWLNVGLPLPAGVGGWAESMDTVLSQGPVEDPEVLMARLNHRLPDGLRIHLWHPLPDYASPVGDLARMSFWRWAVPPEYLALVRQKVPGFLDTETWIWDRGPSKADARLDLRALIQEMRWDDNNLCFATAMGSCQAVNPLKMLGAILDLEAGTLSGLVRTQVELKPDARLSQAERFEPKLKNMYEDAVLLGGASNITLVDEDDDEPIRLG